MTDQELRVVALLTLSVLVLLLFGCTGSLGGLYSGTGSHPHMTFLVKGSLGPVEALHAPTTQKGANDLYAIGAYQDYSIANGTKITGGAGWSWWRDWHDCRPDGYCAHDWTNGLTAGLGLKHEWPHAVVEARGQWFKVGPLDAALLVSVGVTP